MTGTVTALYPGTFDPVTNGHLDIIRRAAGLADRLIVAVAGNQQKGPFFPVDERVAMLTESLDALNGGSPRARIEVVAFDTLLIHFAQSMGATVIIRGLRAVSDFEYEFQMAGMNARLDPGIETIFLMAAETTQFISSRFVKEIGRLGGDIADFVPPGVAERLLQRFAAEDAQR